MAIIDESITGDAGDFFEPTYTIGAGDTVYGTVGEFAGDINDNFLLDVEVGVTYTITIDGFSTFGIFNYGIYNSDGLPLPLSLNADQPDNVILFTPDYDGQFFLSVSQLPLTSYTLTMTADEGPDPVPELPTEPTEGDDNITGTAGNDSIDMAGGDDVYFGGDGFDSAIGGAGSDELYGEAGDDFLRGGGGADYLDGGIGNDYINGQGGGDEVWGGAGDDTLLGGGGNDYLGGEDGNDALYGGSGRDTLDGWDGDDTLTGGSKADTFQFYEAEGNDVITDFDTSEDMLELYGFTAATLDLASIADDSSGALVLSFASGQTLTLQGLDLSDVADISYTTDALLIG